MAPKKQCTVFVTFQIQPTKIEEFKAAHRPVWAACAAEPECLFFDVFQDPEKPGRFRFVEVWNETREWFEKHQMTKPYYETLWAKSKPTWEADPVLEYFEREGEGCVYRKEYLNGGKQMD